MPALMMTARARSACWAVDDMLNEKQIMERFNKAKARRSNWVNMWQDIYYLAMPMLESFFWESSGVENMDQIVDETAVVGVQEFASKLQHGLVPNGMAWARFEAGSAVPEADRQRVQIELDAVTNYVFEVINNSNFATQVPEAFLDLAVGTGNMVCDEGPAHDPIRFEAISLTQVYLLQSSYGKIDHIFRKRCIKGYEVLDMFPNATFSENHQKAFRDKPMGDFNFLQCVILDPARRDNETWHYDLICMMDNTSVEQDEFSGQGSNPWVNFRWMVRAGEVWGRGPMVFALPAIRTINLTQRLILENAEMAISGMWQQDDDGIVNVDTIKLIPGTVVPRAPGSRGLEPMNSAARFDVGQMIVKDMQDNIKRDLYILDLGPTDTTPMSATEVAARQADIANRIGSAHGRLEIEFSNAILMRVVYILKKKGLIKLPKVNGSEVKITAVSPLARAQRNDEIMKLTQFMGMAGQMLGPQGSQLYIKPDEALAQLAEWYEIPQKVLTTDEERQDMMQKIQEAAMQMEQQQPGSAQEVAKVAQSMTA